MSIRIRRQCWDRAATELGSTLSAAAAAKLLRVQGYEAELIDGDWGASYDADTEDEHAAVQDLGEYEGHAIPTVEYVVRPRDSMRTSVDLRAAADCINTRLAHRGETHDRAAAEREITSCRPSIAADLIIAEQRE